MDLETTRSALRSFVTVRHEYQQFRRAQEISERPNYFPDGTPYFVYRDRWEQAGTASGHYFHQDLLVAKEIFVRQPARHIDVGSSLYGLVSHVAAFREIDVLDIRPLCSDVAGIRFFQQDVMNLDDTWHCSTPSLSCLHALEHFGLGRYGDPIDVDGWRVGLHNLFAMLEPNGILYLSVPTGVYQRVEFNAHRVFSLPWLRDVLVEHATIVRLAFINDEGVLLPDIDPFGTEAESSFGARYGCSVWILKKLSK